MYIIEVYEKLSSNEEIYRGIFLDVYYHMGNGQPQPFIEYSDLSEILSSSKEKITVYKTRQLAKNKIHKLLVEIKDNPYCNDVNFKIKKLSEDQINLIQQAEIERKFINKCKRNKAKTYFYTVEELNELYIKYRNMLGEQGENSNPKLEGKIELLKRLINRGS